LTNIAILNSSPFGYKSGFNGDYQHFQVNLFRFYPKLRFFYANSSNNHIILILMKTGKVFDHPLLMKQFIAPLLLTLLFLTFLPVYAQNKAVEEIITSFKVGSSRDLARYFENTVELNVNGSQGDFSKSQAELVFRDFFKKNPANDFQVVHTGESMQNIKYYIGYYSSLENTFRVLIKTKETNDQIKIFSLDFKKD
jgi:hypothetical protein